MSRTFPIEIDMRGPETPLSEVIESFRITNEARLSPHTMVGYLKELRFLDRRMGYPRLREFTLEAVAGIVAETYKHSKSRGRLLAATAKAFASWMARASLCCDPQTKRSVLERLGTPKFNGRREAFTDTEFKGILKALDTLPGRTRARDRAVTLTLMGCGLRLNELRQLRLADVHIIKPISESSLDIRWETSKSRTARKVRVDPMIAGAIHTYVTDHRPASRHAELFLTEEGKPFTYWGMQGYLGKISNALEARGIEGFNAHRCRHQWATMGARAGMTEFELCQEGGWRQGSKVPSRYVHEIPFEELRQRPTALSMMARKAS